MRRPANDDRPPRLFRCVADRRLHRRRPSPPPKSRRASIDGYRLIAAPPRAFRGRSRFDREPVAARRPQKWRGDADALAYVQHVAGRRRRRSRVVRGAVRRAADVGGPTPSWRRARSGISGAELPPTTNGTGKRSSAPSAGASTGTSVGFRSASTMCSCSIATDGSELPTFRFLQHASYPSRSAHQRASAGAVRTIALNKPPRTIRIAFVGASTTVGPHAEPYSYPELVGLWLNRGPSRAHSASPSRSINAGREALNSRSFQAIVRQELLPVRAGSRRVLRGPNQFWPGDFVTTPVPPPQPHARAWRGAAWRRIRRSAPPCSTCCGRRPSPARNRRSRDLDVDWPRDLDEQRSRISRSAVCRSQLPRILGDLETIRRTLDDERRPAGDDVVRLAGLSRAWCWIRRATPICSRYLNTTFWPFTYAHMRRFLDFQTRVFRKYAAVHHLDFIDVASALSARSASVRRRDPHDARRVFACRRGSCSTGSCPSSSGVWRRTSGRGRHAASSVRDTRRSREPPPRPDRPQRARRVRRTPSPVQNE